MLLTVNFFFFFSYFGVIIFFEDCNTDMQLL